MKQYICVDIGGTEMKHGIITEEGKIAEKGKMPTEAWKGGPEILEKLLVIIGRYLVQYKAEGVCVSTAGMVDVEKGEIFYAAPLIPNYTGTGIKAAVEQAYHLPCEVENDVNCAGLAEVVSGAAAGAKAAVCLTVGTGIGGSILIDGKVFHGGSGSACEIGYMHMENSDFQTLGAASVLVKKVAEKKGEPKEAWNGLRVFEQAGQGDGICISAIEEMCDVLGKGIANICYVINPQVVVLGGGIMAQREYLRPILLKALDQYLISSIRQHTELRFAVYGNDSGMLGAFYHFQGRRKHGVPQIGNSDY